MQKSNKPKLSGLEKKEERAFYMFISPWLLGFIFLTAGPLLYSLYASFTDWSGISAPVFTGLNNLRTIFTEDDKFWISLKNTFYYAIFSVPINLLVAFLLAMALNQQRPGRTLFRSIFYLPSVVAGVAVYITWSYLFNAQTGYINYILSLFNIEGPGWLIDPRWAMPSIILMSVTFCGSTMLIFLAGLQDIPEEMYEAAEIDGANSFQKTIRITLPLLSPVIFYNLVMGIIGALQVFTQPYIMTGGGPLNATYVYGLHIYNHAFRYYNFGYSSALAWILFVIVMLLTTLVFRSSQSWVHSSANN